MIFIFKIKKWKIKKLNKKNSFFLFSFFLKKKHFLKKEKVLELKKNFLCSLYLMFFFFFEIQTQKKRNQKEKQKTFFFNFKNFFIFLLKNKTTTKSNLVDSASSHTLVSKIKPCMSKYKLLYTSETAYGSLYQLLFLWYFPLLLGYP